MRDKVYKRYQDKKAIKHKKHILLDCWNMSETELAKNPTFIDGKLNKGKVHCSCPICSHKSKYYGEKKKYKFDLVEKVEGRE